MGSTSGDDLFSEDVLIHILVWLPVISLIRFKSVCKSWRALIQSPFFIDLHTSTTFNSSYSKFASTFILQISTWDSSDMKMIMLTSGSGSGGGGGNGDEDDDFYLRDLGFSSCYKDFLLTESIRMVGSCNGLICLHDDDLRDVSLWNPATRQFRILPKSITIEEKQEEEGIGDFIDDFVAFGFDVKTKDYKVVQITFFTPTERDCLRTRLNCICRVQVYSLSTDSWRLLEGIHSLPIVPEQGPFRNHGIYLNGSYFFVGRIFKVFSVCDENSNPICNNSLMLSFDFTKEIFTSMQFPDHDTRHNLVLSYLGNKIALFTARMSTILGTYNRPEVVRDHDDNEYYDIWVLNEHSSSCSSSSSVNKESWTKLHSFQIKFRGVIPLTQPRCILNDGEFALISNKTDDRFWAKLQVFDLVTKEVKFDIIIGQDVFRADVYKPSLVSIIGGNGAAAAADRVVGGAI